MDNLNKIYLEEVNELLERLESALLVLENNTDDREMIDEIFRVMHTLKGNSSMFGFSLIADFVHHLETIYDLVREGKMKITGELFDITLRSMDHLKSMIYDVNLKDETNKQNNDDLSKRIAAIIENSAFENNNAIHNARVSESDEGLNQKVYHVFFNPKENILENGTNPLYIVDELVQMGESIVIPVLKKQKNFESFDPKKCITSWDIIISTNHPVEELEQVFVFVSDDCELIIKELAQNIDFAKAKEWCEQFVFDDQRIDIEDLIERFGIQTTVNEDGIDADSGVLSDKNKKKEHTSHNKSILSVRVPSEKLDELMNLVSELVTTQAGLSLHAETHKEASLLAIAENVEKLSRRLRDIAFGMTLIPINHLFGRFTRMVRDGSAELNKNIDFESLGGETELDKTIIESLSDPLMHLLRNSIDHGIESKAERQAKGKPAKGKILLKAYYSGAYVHIRISDDGRGIDPEKIKKKAIDNELISPAATLTKREIFDLIFLPGFSTAETITNVSGRGVGMDVVKKNISNLRGEILVDSEIDKGTTITIQLPLTLSIIDGLLVDIDGEKYVIPLSVVDKCYEIEYAKMINNFNELLILDDVQVPFLNLRREFSLGSEPPEKVPVIVVNNGDRRVGLSVDNIVGEYQAVLKPLGHCYKNQDFISGATILGDGSIALVMDTNKIINQFSTNKSIEV